MSYCQIDDEVLDAGMLMERSFRTGADLRYQRVLI